MKKHIRLLLAALGVYLLLLCLLLLHLAEIDSLGLNYTAPLSDGGAAPLSRLLLRGPKREAETRVADRGRES